MSDGVTHGRTVSPWLLRATTGTIVEVVASCIMSCLYNTYLEGRELSTSHVCSLYQMLK